MAKSVPKMSAQDVAYAVKELEAWKDGQRGRKLTWSLLEKATGFTRQTLSAKEEIYAGYEAAKEALATGARPRRPKSDDYQLNKIAELEKELKQYEKLEEDWFERWIRIAYHARGKGFSIDDLDQEIPPVART
jgi:hypothetical protein